MGRLGITFLLSCLVFIATPEAEAEAACHWRVDGKLQDKTGRALPRVKVKLKAKWTGRFPYNDPNWPDVITGSDGRFSAKTIKFLDCRRKRDVSLSVHDGSRWREVRVLKNQRGPRVRFGNKRVGFINLPKVTPAPGGRLACSRGEESSFSWLCGQGLKNCRGSLGVGGGLSMPYYRTHSLAKGHRTATRAVIIVHGNGRTADGYFKAALAGIKGCNALDRTVVIAPKFLAKYPAVDDDEVKPPDNPTAKQIFWDGNNGWKYGGDSSPQRSPRKSGYDVIDRIVDRLAKRSKFPRLKTIVIAGHSAGGMFVQRYAMGSDAEKKHKRLRFRYVVSNPSSYAYLNNKRLKTNGHRRWGVTGAPGGNAYIYGLDLRNRYMLKKSAKKMRRDYPTRKVAYFMGKRDTEEEWLDMAPAANAQGKNRAVRGYNFVYYMNQFFRKHRHQYFVIDKGHSSWGMFSSATGGYLLSHF